MEVTQTPPATTPRSGTVELDRAHGPAMHSYHQQEAQEVQPAKEVQVVQKVQKAQLVQKVQEVQKKVQEAQKVQKAQVVQEVQVAQKMQEVQVTQEAQKAQVVPVARLVCDKVDQLCGVNLSISEVSREKLKALVMEAVILSWKSSSLNKQLQPAVVKFVCDRLQRMQPMVDPCARQELVSKLFFDLVDQLHIALSKIYPYDEEKAEDFYLGRSQLRHFAHEAEALGEYDVALQYRQKLLVLFPDSLSWFYMGRFYMLMGDHLMAQECYTEALNLDPNHQPSLIMSGVLGVRFEQYTDALLLLQQAAVLDRYAVVAWTVLGLLHQIQEDQVLAEKAFLVASQLLKFEETKTQREAQPKGARLDGARSEGGQPKVAPAAKPVLTEKQNQSIGGSVQQNFGESEKECLSSSHKEKSLYMEELEPAPSSRIFHLTCSFLLHNNALQMAELALVQELLAAEGSRSVSFLLHKARLQLQQSDWCSALADLEEALSLNDENTEAWALKGQCHLLQGAPCRAKRSYERSLIIKSPAADNHLVQLRLGALCLEESQFEQAKLLYLEACERSPSCLSWLGVGVACYRLEELGLSEAALAEANYLNDQNPKVWIYLSFIWFKAGGVSAAERAYRYSLQFKLQDQSLITEYKEMRNRAKFTP